MACTARAPVGKHPKGILPFLQLDTRTTYEAFKSVVDHFVLFARLLY